MGSPDIPSEAGRALSPSKAFFAAPNRCDPASMGEAAGDRQVLQASIRRYDAGISDRGVLLPFREQEGGPTAWYACASSPQMLRALQDEVRAFLGPSYCEELPHGRVSDAADAHALPLIEARGWHALRFDTAAGRRDEVVLRQWRLYDQLVSRRPRAPSYVSTTFNQIRASFDRALLARDEPGARAAMASLRERFGVSAENRQFLEIRLHAAFERWDEIAEHELLPQLVHLALPPETYGDVLEALYRSRVEVWESAGSLEPLLAQFRVAVAGPAQPLFSTRRTSRRPAALKSFVLYELIQDEPQRAVCDRLLKDLPIGAFGPMDRILRDRCAQRPDVTDLSQARQALDREEFDRAWDLLWPLHDDVEVLRGLIACAREAADPSKASAVLTRLDAADAAIRSTVEVASATRLANLRAGYRSPPPQDRLAAQFERWEGEPEDRYVERWTEFARSVDPAALLTEHGLIAAAKDSLLRISVDAPALFERVYPQWHELFIERIDPDPRLVPLYVEMLETLRARDVFQRSDLELLHQTLVAIVDCGDDAAYRNAVDAVSAIFTLARSPQVLGWALDVCDSLAQRRVRDADARLRLLMMVIQACREFSARLEPLHIQQLRLLALEAQLDLPPLEPPAETTGSREKAEPDATSYRVVLYSLGETATLRAVHLLRALHPHWVVDTSADLVCTDRLKSLARHAHVFVFAWRCSKHAAYFCVKAHAQKDRLVMARGVGTASLIAAAIDYLKTASD